MNPFSSGTRMRDTIQAIRSCKTAAEERTVVRKECAAIRSAISENDQFYSHRNLAKLMFFHMLGYPTHFGQMECLKLIASPGFPGKRIGYLGLMLLLDERQEVLMLVTNSIKQDLNHTNQYIAGLALCALGNIGSAEMARDLSPEVERLLLFRDPNIRKKAALCSIRIIKKVPDLAENFINSAAALLKEKHHGVLLTGIRLCTDLSKISTVALEHFKKKCIDDLVKVLRDLAHSPYAPEYDISGITDPFLQIRLLKLLCILGQGDAGASDAMNDILAQVATKTESNKNSGNAILYECAATIMSIEENVGLRVLAVNILGRFLSSRDNNIRRILLDPACASPIDKVRGCSRYVALNMLMKAIVLDSQAVQRHRATLLECVKDSDASIRKRALELVCLLVNENNVKSLTKELVNYLKTSDPEFMGDLTAKICSIVEKFAPDKMWRIDQMLKVLSQAGNHVKDDVWHSLIVVITSAPNLHGYSVRSLYKAVQTAGEQETLVRVSVWCIGEYGDMLVRNTGGMLDVENPITVTEGDAVDVVETALGRHSLDLTTRAMCLVSLLKLSHRFPACSQRINDIICHYKGSFALELQLRAVEFNAVIEKHQNIRSALVERMPVHDEAISSGRTDSVASAVTTSHGALSKISVAKSTLTPLIDLIDLCSDDNAPGGGGSTVGNFLKDLLELDVSTDSSQGNTEAPKSGTDALLGPFPIGTLLARSSSSPLDHLLSQEKSCSTAVLGKLTSPSHLSQGSSSVGNSSVIDLLNVIGTRQSLPETKSPAYPAIVAFESSSLRITFDFSKEPGSPQTTLIEAHFINKSLNVYTNFLFQAAIPKYLQLHLDPASSSTLPANTDEYITQKLRITNSQHGKKPLIMRVRINYKMNSKDVTEEGQINNFPREL